MSADLNRFQKAAKANVFRRIFIKRRSADTGLFEDDWFEITKDVKSWGRVSLKADEMRPYKFTTASVKTVFANREGRFNPSDDEASYWFGYLDQQRTLVKIECGFFEVVDAGFGVKQIAEYPGQSFPLWDIDIWDEAVWDIADGSSKNIFFGVISGDIGVSDQNQVTFNIKPLQSVFEDFPAERLTAYGSSLTASEFVTRVCDQEDESGNPVFLPFFGNTTTGFNIEATTNTYGALLQSDSPAIAGGSTWDLLTKIAEAENFTLYINKDGQFNFISQNEVGGSSVFEFHGAGAFNSEYGNTIKKVNSYGFKVSKFYSGVRLKFRDADTSTSYWTERSLFQVGPNNSAWTYGDKQLDIENLFLGSTDSAANAAQTIFDNVSSFKREIEFETSLVLGLDIFDLCSMYYDPSDVSISSLWDQNNWAADDTNSAGDLIWDKVQGDQIFLDGREFKFISIEYDLDNLQNKIIAREV